jgi:hypothetical protein
MKGYKIGNMNTIEIYKLIAKITIVHCNGISINTIILCNGISINTIVLCKGISINTIVLYKGISTSMNMGCLRKMQPYNLP